MTDANAEREIEQLIYQYARACDIDGVGPDQLMTEIFTSDVVLEGSLMGRYAGAEGVEKWASEVSDMRKRCTIRHIITNLLITVLGEEASAGAYLVEIATYIAPVPGRRMPSTEVLFTGDYDFSFLKTADGWRISRRVIRVIGA
jgi:hypothetical protein